MIAIFQKSERGQFAFDPVFESTLEARAYIFLIDNRSIDIDFLRMPRARTRFLNEYERDQFSI